MCSMRAQLCMQEDLQNSNFCRNPDFFQRGRRENFTLWNLSYSGYLWYHVNILYAGLYIISVQYKFIAIEYVESLKETQSQHRDGIYPRKPSWGRKTIQNFLCIRCIRYNPKNRDSPPFVLSLSLSPMCYSSEWVCVLMRRTTHVFIHFKSLKFLGRLH